MTTHYQINTLDATAHLLEVSVTWVATATVHTVELPSWTPGSYMIREYAKHVTEVLASQLSQQKPAKKINKSSWLINDLTVGQSITWVMQIYANDTSVRGAYFDADSLLLNMACVLPWVHGLENKRCELDITPYAPHWSCATAMDAVHTDARGFGRYAAADYDELLDHPIVCGDYEQLNFVLRGVPHALVLLGGYKTDLRRLHTDTERIVSEIVAHFHPDPSEVLPYPRYLFQLHAVKDGFGGLEHRASTRLLCSRNDLPILADTQLREGYIGLLGLISHEFYHTWNVKRIKPEAYLPYRLNEEAYSTQLWLFEGFTAYYDDLCVLRAGCITEQDYLKMLGRSITRHLRNPGRLKQSLAEASFDTWIKYYRPDENSNNSQTHYYRAGSLFALCLDTSLLSMGSSLDHLMRELWLRYGAHNLGVPEGGFLALLNEQTGQDWSAFFAQCVDGCGELPLAESLRSIGLKLHTRAALNADDKGGSASPQSEHGYSWLSLGLEFAQGLTIKTVRAASAAHTAGLSNGDEILALDGLRITAANGTDTQNLFARVVLGESLKVDFVHAGRLCQTDLLISAAAADTAWVSNDPYSDVASQLRKQAWLSSRLR
jgi:predicted metalloprotease with PDZ domain